MNDRLRGKLNFTGVESISFTLSLFVSKSNKSLLPLNVQLLTLLMGGEHENYYTSSLKEQ